MVAIVSCLVLCLVQARFKYAVEGEVARQMIEVRRTIELEVVEKLCQTCAEIQVTGNKSEVYHVTKCKAIQGFDESNYRKLRPCKQCTLSALGVDSNTKAE